MKIIHCTVISFIDFKETKQENLENKQNTIGRQELKVMFTRF
jgi:hypothetical protein